MKNITCCFTGHRAIDLKDMHNIKKNLEQEIIHLVEQGVVYFGCGGAIGFDTLAALTVIDLKKKYNHIKLILVLPCVDQDKFWNEEEKAVYEYVKTEADKVRIISQTYYRGCMQKRNRHLVDNSRFCISYLRRTVGGTAYTVGYAKRCGLNVIEI